MGGEREFPPKPKEQIKKNPNKNIKPDAEEKTQKGVRAMKVQHVKQKDVLVKDVKSQTSCYGSCFKTPPKLEIF